VYSSTTYQSILLAVDSRLCLCQHILASSLDVVRDILHLCNAATITLTDTNSYNHKIRSSLVTQQQQLDIHNYQSSL